MTLSSVPSVTQSVPDAPVTPANENADATPAVAKAPEDKVQLSVAAQAKSLAHQGQSVTQIASNLALPVKTVDEYLGITESSVLQSLAALVQPSGR